MSAYNWADCPKCLRTNAGSEGTFREDYEIGMLRDGEFYVRYKGRCTVCKFEHEFKLDDRALPKIKANTTGATYP